MLTFISIALAVAIGSTSRAPSHASQQPLQGVFALTGPQAASYQVPADTTLVKTLRLDALGLVHERYQQRFGTADVLGGQITVYRDLSGQTLRVIGGHYPTITSSNAPRIALGEAEQIAGRDIGPASARAVKLEIDPVTGRYFFAVHSQGFDSRWVHWVDASSGAVLRRIDLIQNGDGTGVKGDTKDLTGLTAFHQSTGHGASGPHYDLNAPGGRLVTYNARNGQNFVYFVTDGDDAWNVVTGDRRSPGHPALIDAQYYAATADDYYLETLAFDWVACTGLPAIRSVGHFKRDYDNAFWNGGYVVYGDGDGVATREFSGALDIVAHELSHGVTECTSNLIYADESGALNEAFSDIMGNSAEFYADANGRDPSVTPDWLVGEDIMLIGDDALGFRNMGNPAEDGDPDHYSERQIGGPDSGGVHTNSGIVNHAYYLLVNGGQNVGCALGHAHCTADGAINVNGIGLASAREIFFLGFIGLPNNATMCDARLATEATAAASQASVAQAWKALGLTDSVCGIAGTPTPTSTPSATATSTATATPSATATFTATATASFTATATTTFTPTATATFTPTATAPTDTDGDGVSDAADNCPAIPNPGQENADSMIGNGAGLAGHDATVPHGDPADTEGDACESDGDADNDGTNDASDSDPGGDVTYDDDGDGFPAAGCLGGSDAADDGPSWDANCDGALDGLDPAACAALSSFTDADGDFVPERHEVCKWGASDSDTDSDDDGLSDCLEIVDVDGSGTKTFLGDLLSYARAVQLSPDVFGRDGDFDYNGDDALSFLNDLFPVAKLVQQPVGSGGCDPTPAPPNP